MTSPLIRQTRDSDRTELTSHSTILENPKFKQWFAGSKVVDDRGLPLVCYHGTFEEFTEFKYKSATRESYGFNRLGFWFDVHPATANFFAGYEEDHANEETGSVMPVFLNIKKPFMLNSEYLFGEDRDEYIAKKNTWLKLLQLRNTTKSDDRGNYRLPDGKYFDDDLLRKAEKQYDAIKATLDKERSDGFNRMMKLLPNGASSTTEQVAAFQAELISAGHDGIHLEGTIADWGSRGHQASDWWIAFDSNQIKSIWNKEFTASPHIHEDKL